MDTLRRAARLVSTGLLVAAAATAQTDTARVDSAAADTIRGGDDWLLAGVAAGVVAALAVAPPALLLVHTHGPPDSLGGLPHHLVSAFGAAGIGGTDPDHGLAYSTGLQLFEGPIFADARGEALRLSSRTRFVSGEVGYLLRPAMQAAGGLTLGYRRSELPAPRGALQVGLPLFLGNSRATMFFEPTYLISGSGLNWTWRCHMELYVLPRPLFAGALFEVEPMASGHSAMISLLFGVRH